MDGKEIVKTHSILPSRDEMCGKQVLIPAIICGFVICQYHFCFELSHYLKREIMNKYSGMPSPGKGSGKGGGGSPLLTKIQLGADTYTIGWFLQMMVVIAGS